MAHASALHRAASLQPDGTWPDLAFSSPVLPDTGKPAHLERTLLLAKAHRTAAGALDDPLRRALDLWLANDFTSLDWRDNQIAIPRIVGEIALLYDSGLSAGAAGKVMEILARSRWANWVAASGWVERSGMDLLGVAYNYLLRGCLENAPSFFDAAFGRIFREIRQVTPGEEGIQADMTFRAPKDEHAGGGFVFMRECAQFIAYAHGTPWQAPAETVKLFAGFLLDGQQWMMRQGTMDTGTAQGLFSEVGDLDGMATVVQQLAQLGNPPRRLELAAFAHRLQGRGEALSGHRYFWRARMAVHQRPAFYSSLRLATPDSSGTKAASFPSRTARITSCGQGASIMASRRPCPTTRRRARRSSSTWIIQPSKRHLGMTATRRVGSRAALAKVTVAWRSRSSSGRDSPAKRRGSSSTNLWSAWAPVCTARLRTIPCARRSTIAFARAGVRQVSQRRASAACARAGAHPFFDSRGGTRRDQLHFSRTRFRFRAGWRPPTRVGLSLLPAPRQGFACKSTTDPRPRGAAWIYLVLPTGDDPETVGRVADEVGCIEVLVNSPTLQAVRHGGLGLLGVAFWEPGVVPLPGGGRVAANRACLLLCRDLAGGSTRLSISNPTGEAATVHVEYGGKCVCFELPDGLDAGRGMSRLL